MLKFLIGHTLPFQFRRTFPLGLSLFLVVLLTSLPAYAFSDFIFPAESLRADGTSSTAFTRVEDVRVLAPGEIVRRNMKGGDSHPYQLALAPRQYARIVVEQQGIDVIATISDPGGQVIAEMDSPNGLRGPEIVSVSAQLSGTYIIEVSADKSQPSGGYELRVEGPRESSAADEKRVEAERTFVAAQKLRRQGTPISRAQAIDLYGRALDLWREIGDTRGEGYTLCAMGRTYKAMGELAKTLDYFDQALARLREIQDISGQAFALNEVGAAHRDLGDPLLALDSYARALELRSNIGDQWGQGLVRNNIGHLYSKIGRQQKAIENLEQALPLWHAVGDRGMELNTLNNIAKSYMDMGYLAEAAEKFTALSISCNQIEACQLEPYILNSLGLINDTWAEPQEALKHYEKALGLFGEMNNQEGERGQAIVLDNMGMVYAGLGDAQRALEYFPEALKLRQLLKEPGGEAVTQSNMGYAHTLLGNHQEALKHLNLALPLSRLSHNRPFEAYTLVRIGMAYTLQNEPQRALEYYRQALDIQQEKDFEDRRGQAITLDQIGQAYALLGDSTRALNHYGEALKGWLAVGDKQGQALSLYGIARVERDRNNLPTARDKVEEAIAIIESLRSKTTGHQLRMIYFAGKQDFYALAVDVRMRLYERNRVQADAEAALFATERARARDLLDLLTEARVDLVKGMSPHDAEKKRRLEQEINTLTQSWLRLRGLKRTDDAVAVETKLKSLIDEQERFLTAIRSAKTTSAGDTQSRTLRAQEIQQLLDNETLLLEYAVNEERVYLWAVTRDSISPYSLANRSEIERAAAAVRRMLTAYEPPKSGESDLQYLARLTTAAAQYTQGALELSRMVLGPIASKLGKKRLVIVADGVLQYIPFEALPAPDAVATAQSADNASGHLPLLSQYEVVYQSSASTLAMLRAAPRHTATKTVAVIADPVFDRNDRRVRPFIKGTGGATRPSSLPRELSRSLRDVGDVGADFKLARLEYTAKEANAIAAAAPPGSWMKAVSFKANRATATGRSLKQFSIVHFATHGIVNDKHPELSGIVLSMVNETGQPEDGYLRLGDIYNLDLPVDLVVLSACQTGIGKQVRGEGLIGLTRGFMYAGAPRVVASLWKVNDEATSELMRRFYHLMLRQKIPAAAALRRAKIEMMARPQWRNPYYWAGFVLQGDWK